MYHNTIHFLQLTGLAITAVGFVLRYGKSLYEPFLETGMNQLQKALDNTNLKSFDVDSIDIGEVRSRKVEKY